MIHFFFHLSKMRLTIGNEVLNTDTMRVTTKDDPNQEFIAWISLKVNSSSGSIPRGLVITFKNENKVIKSYYKPSEVYFEDKDLTP